MRFLFFPLAIIFLVVGFFVDDYKIIIWGASALFIILGVFAYSGRKQRIRYWFQGYKTYLGKNSNDEDDAIKSVKLEFCSTKYANKNICGREYESFLELIEDILKVEFQFSRFLGDLLINADPESLKKYEKEVKQLRKEIREIEREQMK